MKGFTQGVKTGIPVWVGLALILTQAFCHATTLPWQLIFCRARTAAANYRETRANSSLQPVLVGPQNSECSQFW